MINKLASLGNTLALTIVEFVVLQTKRAPIDLLENGKQKLMLLHTPPKVLHRWIVGNEFIILTQVPLLQLLIIFHPLNEILRFRLNRGMVLVARPLEQALKLILLLTRQRLILEAFIDDILSQVLLCHLLDCVCKGKHCRQFLLLALQVNQVSDLREVLRILVDLVDRA